MDGACPSSAVDEDKPAVVVDVDLPLTPIGNRTSLEHGEVSIASDTRNGIMVVIPVSTSCNSKFADVVMDTGSPSSTSSSDGGCVVVPTWIPSVVAVVVLNGHSTSSTSS